MTYQNTTLWRNAFSNDVNTESVSRLLGTFTTFRDRASDVTSKIAAEFPALTIHDITHLDALWETADLVAGADYQLNPMEAFVFGGAIFLHDAALCFEAYESGRAGVRDTVVWRDCRALEEKRRPGADAGSLDLAADFMAIRHLHATQAEGLGLKSWRHPTTGDLLHFIEDPELRIRYGALIGKIAGSHHWPIEDLSAKLPAQVNAPGNYPREWRVDPIKIACLLRVADATHIDSRRAPDFLFALLRRQGISFEHWKAQNWLARIDIDQSATDQDSLLISSNRDFELGDSDAWWVAYDAANLADKELSTANSLLASRPNAVSSPPFFFKRITGAQIPEVFAKSVRTSGWQPHSVQLHVGNVRQLVSTLGGTKLYGQGSELSVVLRELIQNARDAVRAREEDQAGFVGRVLVKINKLSDDLTRITIDDDGVGMSERVLTGPLLDFGSSFWASDLVKSEFPGLAASKFRSSGRFGIGFYAAFMVSNNVMVASRRWDRGLDSVTQVIFPSGLSLRPVIKSGLPDLFSGFTSTLVTLDIDTRLFSVDRVPIENEPDGSVKTAVTISGLIAALACGLDVDVRVSLNGEAEQVVHTSLRKPWDLRMREQWLHSISHAEFRPRINISSILDEAAARITDISRDGRIILRAALNRTFRENHFSSGISVDGLGNTQYGSNYYIGFAEHTTETAKRDAAKMVATEDELEVWTKEQIAIINPSNSDFMFWAHLPYTLANIGVPPREHARIFVTKNGETKFFSVSDVFEILKKEPIAFYLSNHLPIIETYIQEKSFENYWTIHPIENGTYIWTDLDEKAKNRLSFLGILQEYAAAHRKKLVMSRKESSVWSIGGLVNAVVLSLGEMT